MSAPDPATRAWWARTDARLHAICDAAERRMAAADEDNASAPASNRSRVVDAGAWEPRELGGNPYGPDLRDAAR